MRVHELAKELGFENKEFIEKLKKVGVDVKSHLSGLNDEQEKSVRVKIKFKSTSDSDKNSKIEMDVNRDKMKNENHIVKEKIVFGSPKTNIENEKAPKENEVKVETMEQPKTTENKEAPVSTNTEKTGQAKPFNQNREQEGSNTQGNNPNRSSNWRNNNNNNQNRDQNNTQGNNPNRSSNWRSNNNNNQNRDQNNTPGNNPNRSSNWSQNRPNNNNNNQNRDQSGTPGSNPNRSSNWRSNNPQNRDQNNTTQGNNPNRSSNWRSNNPQNRDQNNTTQGNNPNRSSNWKSNNPQNRDQNNTTQGNNPNRSSNWRSNNTQNRDRNSPQGNNQNRSSNWSQNRNSTQNRDQNNAPGNKDAAKPVTPAVEEKKTKTIKPSVKKKFDKKKYEDEKRKKDEEKKLNDIRSDFRKEDKKKKFKKKDRNAGKSDIIRAEGEDIGTIRIRDEISIKELAEKLGINISDIIKKFFMEGKILTANAILNFEEAESIALEYEVLVEKEEVEEVSYGDKYDLELDDKSEELKERPPVITIMGHVDHGKTSLLDALRKTHVMDGEAGGITQKIGAYQIKWKDQKITFIDTPGHEAFTEMRSRGAKVTDIAILIVAADDGVKPQTVEAISHAKEAGVPIIVAINKIDKQGANPLRVKQELLEYGLVAPEWGGQTEFVEISAKNRVNLEELLETIVITSELLELKANPKKRAKAVVIESRLDPKMGAVADILIQEGQLKIGDIFVAGESYGRVRSMLDDRGAKETKANLSQPVEITGFNNIPEAGDVLYVVNNDKQAKKIVEDFLKERKQNEQNKKKHISLESLSKELEDQQLKELKCILRGDSKGSVEALKESLEKLSDEKVMINIIQASAGAITEGDVKLAEASNAIIIGFHVRPTTPARNEAEKLGVEIRTYNVIYHITEEIEKAMKGLLDPEFKEIYHGRIEVQKVFKVTGAGNIAGAVVVDGKVLRDSKIRVLRDSIIIYEGEIGSLKRFKDDAKEVVHGQECGIGIKDFNDIKEGDLIEAYILEEIPR